MTINRKREGKPKEEVKPKDEVKPKEDVKPTEEVIAKEEIKPTEDTKHEELSIDTPQEQPVNEQVTAPKIETSDDTQSNYIQVSKKAERQLRNAAIITVGYTLVSNRLASRNAVAANAETQSQSKYEDFVSQSDFWERQQNTSMLIAAEITSTYFLCRTLRKSMSPQNSDSSN